MKQSGFCVFKANKGNIKAIFCIKDGSSETNGMLERKAATVFVWGTMLFGIQYMVVIDASLIPNNCKLDLQRRQILFSYYFPFQQF